MQVFVLVNRPSSHSLAHGKRLAFKVLFQDALKASGAARVKEKRGPAKTHPAIQVEAPPREAQVVQFADVSPLEGTLLSGLDLMPKNVLEIAPQLLQRELEDGFLSVESSEVTGRGLFTRRAFRDGEVITTCSALLFASEERVRTFLALPDHDTLRDRLVAVTGVYKEDTPTIVYAVLLGAAGFVQNYVGTRHRPNACLIGDVSTGANRGFLKLVCKTRNGCGLAKKQEIFINYGNSEWLDMEEDSPDRPSRKKSRRRVQDASRACGVVLFVTQ